MSDEDSSIGKKVHYKKGGEKPDWTKVPSDKVRVTQEFC